MSNLVERPVDTELLSAYLDGALTTEQQRDVEAQLAASAAWREELDSLRWSMDIVRQTPDVALPRSFEISVVAAPVMSASVSETRRPWWANTAWLYGLTRSAAAVSVALLIAVIGLDAWQTTRSATSATPTSMIAFEAPVAAQAPAPASAPAAAEARKAPVEAPKAAAQPQAPPVQAIPAAPSPFPPGSSAPSGAGGGGAGAGAGAGGNAGNPPAASAPVVRPTVASPSSAEAVPFGLPTAAPQTDARRAPVPVTPMTAAPHTVSTPTPQAGNPYRAAEIGLAVLAAVLAMSAIVLRVLTRR